VARELAPAGSRSGPEQVDDRSHALRGSASPDALGIQSIPVSIPLLRVGTIFLGLSLVAGSSISDRLSERRVSFPAESGRVII